MAKQVHFAAAAALCVLAACSSHSPSASSAPSSDPGAPGKTLASIAIAAPTDQSVPTGIDVPFTATGTYSDGTTEDVTASVDWSSSDPTVASFATDDPATAGQAMTHAAGTVTITARSGDISATATLTVDAPSVDRIDISPDAPTILVNTSLKLAATATLSDGSAFDLLLAQWQSSDPTVVSVASDGTVYAGATTGFATITATDPVSQKSASTIVTVTPIPGLLSYVSVKPGSVEAGSTRLVVGTVALTSPPTPDFAPLTVALAASDAVVAFDTSSLAFDTSTSTMTFHVTTSPSDRRTKVTITATAPNTDPQRAGETVTKTATLRVRQTK